MSKTLALFFFFFCLQFIAQNTAAQDLIVYDEVKRFNWNLQTEPEEFQTMVSQFNLKSNVLGFEVTYHGQLIKKESNTYQIHLLFDQFSSISDLNYRGFELTSWLYSLQFCFYGDILEQNSKKLSPFKFILNPNLNQVYDSTFMDLTQSGAFTLTNEKVANCNSQLIFEEIANAKKEIDSFYFHLTQVENFRAEFESLKPINIPKLNLQLVDIKYLNKSIVKYDFTKYSGHNLSFKYRYDSLFYQFDTLKRSIESQAIAYQSAYDHWSSHLYQLGMEAMDSQKVALAQSYFLKSISIDSNQWKAHYQLGLNYFDLKEYDLTLFHLKPLFSRNDIPKDTILAIKTLNKINEMSSKLNLEERYSESIQNLQIALTFVRNFLPSLPISTDIESTNRSAYHGMYRSFVTMARMSMRRNRIDLTEQYLNFAYDYQSKNQIFITNNSEADGVASLWVTELLRLSISNAERNRLVQARRYFSKADSVVNVHQLSHLDVFMVQTKKILEDKAKPASRQTILESQQQMEVASQRIFNSTEVAENKLLHPTEKLISVDSMLMYNSKIEAGLMYLQYQRFEQAYSCFKDAMDFNLKIDTIQADSLNKWLQMSGKSVVLSALRTSQTYALERSYRMAELQLLSAKDLSNRLQLNQDSQVVLLISNINLQLETEVSMLAKKKFEQQMKNARSSLELKDYISMEVFCKEAIQTAEEYPQAGLNLDFPLQMLDKYEFLIEYSYLVQKIKYFSSQNQLDSTILYYQKSQHYFIEKALLEKIKIFDFQALITAFPISSEAFGILLKSASSTDLIEKLLNRFEGHCNKAAIESVKEAMQILAQYDFKQNANLKAKAAFQRRFALNSCWINYRKYYVNSYE